MFAPAFGMLTRREHGTRQCTLSSGASTAAKLALDEPQDVHFFFRAASTGSLASGNLTTLPDSAAL